MSESFTTFLKESSKEMVETSSDIIPNFFDDIPQIDSVENLDKPVVECQINDEKSDEIIQIITRNESLEGEIHPITGVPFERKIIDGVIKCEGVFPEFKSEFDAQIPAELFEASDRKQFAECNNQLKEAVESDSRYENVFDEDQMDQIKNGDTPDGYVWHHDSEPGKIQLVDFDTHAKTGHTGGRTVWGGGNDNR